MKDDIGENPARFLDRDLDEPNDETTDYTHRRMVRDRIRGIDKLAVVNAWIAVERRLDRGPRDHIIRLLETRKSHLQEYGERDLPDMTREERRERSRELYERVADRKVSNQMEDGPLSATQKLNQMRADGGERE
jgi:hypothetical protein